MTRKDFLTAASVWAITMADGMGLTDGVSTPTPAPTPTPEPPHKLDPLAGSAALVSRTIYAPDDAKFVDVPVCLKEPLNRQVTFDVLTKNGTAKEGYDFDRVQMKGLTIPAGQTCVVVRVPLRANLGSKSLVLAVAWTYNEPPLGGMDYVIRGGIDPNPQPIPAQVAQAPAKAREGRTRKWESNFLEPVRPTAVAGAWRSRFPQHRLQISNSELAPNADPMTDPGVDTHPIRDGKRVLRAHRAKVREGAATYDYAASMVQSLSLFTGRYGYIEARVKVNRAQGTIPAFWLLPTSLAWPPEIDIFEFGLGDDSRMKSTVHYNDAKGVKRMEGVAIPFVPDDQFHTYGLDWTPDWLITLVDGKEVHRRRNPFNEPMYVILNVAVGGLAPAPKNPGADWESTMTLDRIEWWKDL